MKLKASARNWNPLCSVNWNALNSRGPVLEARLVDQVADALRVESPCRGHAKDEVVRVFRGNTTGATAEVPMIRGVPFTTNIGVNNAAEV